MALRELHTEISIAASPECVWAILMDFASYPQWNPFVTSIKGRPEAGAKLAVTIQPVGGKAMHFAPTVLIVAARRELRWRGRLLVPSLFDGEHWLAIEPQTDGTVRFSQSERFSGLLVGLLSKQLERGTRRGFEAMNKALKARAESINQTAAPQDAA